MKKITFDEERRGYDKTQVEKYVSMLQSAIEEMEEAAAKNEVDISDKIKELERCRLEISNLKAKLSAKNQESRGTVQVLTAQLEQAKKDLAQKEEELARLSSKSGDIKGMSAEFQSKLDQKEAQLRSMKEELKGLEDAARERDALQQELKDLENVAQQRDALQKELEESREIIKTEAGATKGMEELFRQAKLAADTYVENIRRQMQEEKIQVEKQNEEQIQKAHEEAARIIEEARAAKQEDLEEKIAQVAKMEADKKAEITELLQTAQDELESAQVEADGIRRQARLILEQTEKRRDKMLARAQEKANQAAGPVREECEKLRQEMEASAVQIANFFKSLRETE